MEILEWQDGGARENRQPPDEMLETEPRNQRCPTKGLNDQQYKDFALYTEFYPYSLHVLTSILALLAD